jgi:hypothetical protein
VTTDRPSDNGVPLRVVVALGLSASVLARCLAPALQGVAGDQVIIWAGRAASLLTLLAATGLVAGIARLATAVLASPRAPLVARLVVVPAAAMGCMLLLFASFRPLEPLLALMLGLSAAVVGALSARHTLAERDKRAGALVLGLTASAGMVHVLSRKLTQDASDAANIAAFRTAQLIETLGVAIDLAALALTLLWLQRRVARGRVLVPLLLTLSTICVLLALRGSAPGAGTLSVLLNRGLNELSREQASLFPAAFTHLLNAAALLTAVATLFAGPAKGELGLIFAASLAAHGALDIPIPALMLELAALYLPFVRPAEPPVPPAGRVAPTAIDEHAASSPIPDTAPP